MKKRLLVYKWGSLSEIGFCRVAKKLGYDFIEFAWEMKNYHADAAFAHAFIMEIHAKKVEMVFSYDYFPMISMICEMNHIPYVCWIYDCPLYTLESKTLINSCNYIFCFDKIYAERLQSHGAVNCYHYPLAADENMLAVAMGKKDVPIYVAGEQENDACTKSYACDISFVGNLYNEKKNRLRNSELEPHAAGFVEELVQKQLGTYGKNFIKEALMPEITTEIVEKCQLKLGPEFRQDSLQMAADAIGMEVSARERELVLSKISTKYPLRLYTSSELPEVLQNERVEKKGYADYQKEVPLIFYNSKINLNITSKTIETGIPQRIFDVLGCGGFCLTNYQKEIAEYFADGEELVMYTGMEDLLNKIDYYLTHEEERKKIALRGQEKVLREFSLTKRMSEMFETIR